MMAASGSREWPQAEELARLLRERTPFLDVRAPVEFDRGSVPGATNLPLLNDEERAAVGTRYKQEGQEAAIALGLQFVSGEVAESRIAAWVDFVRRHPSAHLYCFRGGLRSQSVQRALRERGVEIPLIQGGYKRVRQFLLDSLDSLAAHENFVVLSGYTGSGKTDLLNRLNSERRVVDLEGLAHHRGSAFGKRTHAPPSQADFENRLATDLLRLNHPSADSNPILLEDESRKIGKIEIPAAIFERICSAPVVVIEQTREERARYLIDLYLGENYGLHEGDRDPERLMRLKADMEINLQGIARRLGGLELKNLQEMFASALAEHERSGSRLAHFDWVMRLLERYYDPLYAFHLDRIRDRIVFQGSTAEVDRYFKEHR